MHAYNMPVNIIQWRWKFCIISWPSQNIWTLATIHFPSRSVAWFAIWSGSEFPFRCLAKYPPSMVEIKMRYESLIVESWTRTKQLLKTSETYIWISFSATTITQARIRTSQTQKWALDQAFIEPACTEAAMYGCGL